MPLSRISAATVLPPVFPRLDPVFALRPETDLLDPYAMLDEHPDLSLVIAALPVGERGRWYPALHVIMISDRLNQAERRCTLTHELVHRMRGDVHVSDDVFHNRQEKSCHQTAARILIPFPTLLAAMQWGRDPQELAEELWVDLETLQARICALSESEGQVLRRAVGGDSEWVVA